MTATTCMLADICSLLQHMVAYHGNSIAITVAPGIRSDVLVDQRQLTYAGLYELALALAGRLRDHGVRRLSGGDRVAIVLPNGPDLSIAMLATSIAGVAVPLNPAYSKSEFTFYLRLARASFLIVPSMGMELATTEAERLGIPILRMGKELVKESRANNVKNIEVQPDNLALILPTSGSTSRAKLVPLSHRNLCVTAESVSRSLDLSPVDRVLAMWEQFHIGGIVDLLLAPLYAGGTVISAGSFSATRFFQYLDAYKPTWFQGVPTALHELCCYATDCSIEPGNSSLRFLRAVAAALPDNWAQDLEHRFNVPVVQTYGMTEASPLITSTRLPPAVRKPGSVGVPCGPDVCVLKGSEFTRSTGQTGQIAVRGENIFRGYEGDTTANTASFKDGWFLTGDLGYFDSEGDLFLTGRVKELINRGGEKVTPNEVDAVLLEHPAVEEVATFGVAHPTLGEEVAAAVVLRRGMESDEAALRRHVAEQLAAFKVPRRILIVPSLPRCPVGKVRRRELAELFGHHLASNGSAAPTNGLEAALLALWALELDVERIGIDDDFGLAGGDSLSSVRLVLAAQKLVGRTIPDRMLGRFHTVRAMAQGLAELGCPLNPPFIDQFQSSATGHDEYRKALPGVLETSDAPPPRLLYTCSSALDFEIAQRVVEDLATPHELGLLLSSGLRIEDVKLMRSPRTAMQVIRKRKLLRRQFRSTLLWADQPEAWRRTSITTDAHLYHSPGVPQAKKTLIVGFTGFKLRLMSPLYTVLCALKPSEFDLLLFRDPLLSYYMKGISGIGESLSDVAVWMRSFAGEAGYSRTIALGTSAGGIPAIIAAILADWPCALACSAARPSSDPQLFSLLQTCAAKFAATRSTRSVTLAYSGLNQRDMEAAGEIQKILPMATLAPDQRCQEHALLYELYKAGELKNYLLNMLCRRADEDSHQPGSGQNIK